MLTVALAFIAGHWVDIVALVLGAETAMRYIAKLTPTEVDDAFVAKVSAAIDKLGIRK